MVLGKKPIEIYDAHLSLQGQYSDNGSSMQLILGLNKSCDFTLDKRCTIYEDEGIAGRPIACAIFPEIVDNATRNLLKEEYPCIDRVQVSEERKAILDKLYARAYGEQVISSALLFGSSPYHIKLDHALSHLRKHGVDIENCLTDDKERTYDVRKIIKKLFYEFPGEEHRKLKSIADGPGVWELTVE